MTPGHAFTDDAGRQWLVYDFRTVDGKRKRVLISDSRAEARAFVAEDDGTVMVYAFGHVAYHSIDHKFVADQFRFAKPLRANAAERMTGG